MPAILDRLILAEEFPELVVVMPDGGNRYGGGYYRNSSVNGRWGDYIADDLVDFVDAHFRTLANDDSRAVVGHSMGGYGTLNLAMTRPGIFSVVWPLDPSRLAANDDLSFGNDAWRRATAITSPKDLQDLVDNRDVYPSAVIGIVTAFSPDVDAPPIYGDFPFDIVRGEVVLDDLAYDRYLDALPVRQVRSARDELRNLRAWQSGSVLEISSCISRLEPLRSRSASAPSAYPICWTSMPEITGSVLANGLRPSSFRRLPKDWFLGIDCFADVWLIARNASHGHRCAELRTGCTARIPLASC